MASDLITLLEGAVLTKFVGPAAEHYGKAALEQVQRVSAKAYQYLVTVGREPEPIAPKTLVPLAQAAALETDPGLSAKWAALLANAADPEVRVRIEPSYIEVLRQLTPADSQVLELIYSKMPAFNEQEFYYEPSPIRSDGFAQELGLSQKQYALCVDTLLRLRLCALPTPRKSDTRGALAGPISAATFRVCPTMYGREFILACTPPAL